MWEARNSSSNYKSLSPFKNLWPKFAITVIIQSLPHIYIIHGIISLHFILTDLVRKQNSYFFLDCPFSPFFFLSLSLSLSLLNTLQTLYESSDTWPTLSPRRADQGLSLLALNRHSSHEKILWRLILVENCTLVHSNFKNLVPIKPYFTFSIIYCICVDFVVVLYLAYYDLGPVT